MTATSFDVLPVRHRNQPRYGGVEQPSLSPAQAQSLAAKMKAVGDPTRLRILDLLVQQPAPICVCDLTPQFMQNQPTISHHLKILREVGLIGTEKRGLWAYYWATHEGRKALAAVQELT